jgi:hypothetical protein
MATTTKIIAIGNSAGIILPKETLARLNVRRAIRSTEGFHGIRMPIRTSPRKWKRRAR